jgi:hypothetical protein
MVAPLRCPYNYGFQPNYRTLAPILQTYNRPGDLRNPVSNQRRPAIIFRRAVLCASKSRG